LMPIEKRAAIDNFVGKTGGAGAELNSVFPVLADVNWKSFDPESVASAVCIVVNGKGDELESAQGLSVTAEELGSKIDMRIGSGKRWKRQQTTQEQERGNIPEMFHEFPFIPRDFVLQRIGI
jgi:hypothetical protein